MITEIDLEAIRKRCENATAEPWRWGCWSTTFGECEPVSERYRWDLEHAPTMPDGASIRRPEDVAERVLHVTDGDISEANRDFIRHARTDVPALLALVEELKTENKLLRQTRQACSQESEVIQAVKRIRDANQKLVDDGGVDDFTLSLFVAQVSAVNECIAALAPSVAEPPPCEHGKTGYCFDCLL